MNTFKMKQLNWRQTVATILACCFLLNGNLAAAQIVSAQHSVPPRAMPAHVKRGSKKVALQKTELKFSTAPTDAEIISARVFLDQLAPMHTTPIEGENQAVVNALRAFKKKTTREDNSALTDFIKNFPTSRWRAAIELNLGRQLFNTGYLSDALACWKSAWEQSKDETSSLQRTIADESIGELLLLESRLGRKEELKKYLPLTTKRRLTSSARSKVQAATEGLTCMEKKPDLAYKCGPCALDSLLSAKKGKPVHSSLMFKAKSTDQGTNLAQLDQWAKKLDLKLQVAKRSKGAAIIVPSIMHWKLDHFAAIIKKEGDLYRTKDPTFDLSGHVLLSDAALEQETDGYFMVPAGKLPEGWQHVETSEAKTVWGKGNSYSRDKCKCEDKQSMGPSTCKSCGGLARASVFAMHARLHIEDTPLSYQCPVGPDMSFQIGYNQDNEDFHFGNFAGLGAAPWSFNWLSYLTLDGSGNATVVTRDGLGDFYLYPYSDPSKYSHSKLVNVSSGVYERQLPDGSIEVFNQADGSGRVFMTEVIDPQGNSATVSFDSDFRITTITDAIGQQTTLTYGSNTSTDPGYYAITQIEDPFARSCYLSYDANFGYLMSITDVIGLVSRFTYANLPQFFIDTLTTPYGTTGFYTYIPDLAWNATAIQFLFSDGTTSVLMNELGPSNTYFWDREAMALYPSEIVPDSGAITGTHCRITHWAFAGDFPFYVQTSAPYIEIPPLENWIVYNYPGGQDEPGYPEYTAYITDTNLPSLIKRVGFGPTVTQEWQFSYNSFGNVTETIDPLGRKFDYSYDSNDIDLLEKDQTQTSPADINGIWSSYSNHLPGAYKDGSGQTTSYTYNSYGQLLTKTDANSSVWTNTYDSNGFLIQTDGPLSGSNDVQSFSYDGYGRVYQTTDSEGYVLTFSYDDADRLVAVTYPDGTTEQKIYDKLDVVLTKDRIGRWTQSAFDSLDQLSYVRDPLNRKTSYVWCACGALARLTDGNGNSTSWNHDLEGRITRKIFANQSQTAYFYDADGRLSSKADANGQAINYSYNADNSLNQKSYTNAINPTSTVTYGYDPNYLRLTSIANGWGTISYSYNPYITSSSATTTGAGKIATETNDVISNSDISYAYDALGRVTNRSIDGSSNSSDFAYDEINRITNETNPLGSFDYTYVDDVSGYSKGTNRLASISYPNGQMTNFNWFGNLGDQRLEGIANLTSDGTCLSQFAYGYNPAGEIKVWHQQQGPSNNRVFSLGYDRAGQLTSAQSGSFGTLNPGYTSQYFYNYDAGANRTSAQQNMNTVGIVGGAATTGDTVTITFADANLSGGQESINYVVQSGDDLAAIADGLTAAINADTSLTTNSITAASFSTPQIYIASASPNPPNYSYSVTSGGTETISFGTEVSNTEVNATAVGTPTAGDVVTIVVHDPGLSGGQESVAYTVQSGDALSDIAYNLMLGINGNTALATLGVNGYFVEGSAQILSFSPNVTTYTQSVSTAATEGVVFSLNQNINAEATIDGPVGVGDVLTVTIYDAALPGGSKAVDYTVLSGDDTAAIASGLAAAIAGDSDVSPIVSAYTLGGPVLIMNSFSLNPTTYRASTSAGATETILLTVNGEGGTSANLGATQFQYNNVNELKATQSGGTTAFGVKTNKAVTAGAVSTNVIDIKQKQPSPSRYGTPDYSSATEIITTGPAINESEFATVSGTTTTGDVVSLIVYNDQLPDGQKQVFYTVLSGDSLADVATGLAASINADTDIASLGIVATGISNNIGTTRNGTTYSSSTSSGATESLSIGNNINGNASVAISGAPTAGDILTVTISNAALSGGSESVNYTVLSTDSTVSIAAGLTSLINASLDLQTIGLSASNSASGDFDWTQRFSAKPTLANGNNDAIAAATDGASNVAESSYQVNTTASSSASLTFDYNGNMTSDGVNSYDWDAENRLVKISYPGASNFSSFVYDAYDRNVCIVETTAGSVTSTKQFSWCGNERSEERDELGAATSHFFQYGEKTGGVSYYYGADLLGSVRQMTNSSGILIASRIYDPFGRVSTISDSVTPNFGFARMYAHSRSLLNLARFRVYSSSMSIWLNRDPLSEITGTNLYFYANNNPISQTDRFGLWSDQDFAQTVQNYADAGAVGGFVIGGDIGGAGGGLAGAAGGAGVGAIPGAAIGTVGGAAAGAGLGAVGGAITGAGVYGAGQMMNAMKGKFQKPPDEPPPPKKGGSPRKRNGCPKQWAPEWAREYPPHTSETAQEYAERLLDWKYGQGRWRTGQQSEYNQLVKAVSRSYE